MATRKLLSVLLNTDMLLFAATALHAGDRNQKLSSYSRRQPRQN
jgi:hypothetical protein